MNVSEVVSAVLHAGKATYTDLADKLSIRDMYNLLEHAMVENYNQRVWHKFQEKR